MNWLLILLGVVSVVANATMDELRFHWSRFFGKVIKKKSLLESWANPTLSWVNKYKFKSSILRALFSTALVWTTDLWHLLKTIHLNSIFAIIILLIDSTVSFGHFLLALLMFNVFWGIVFQGTFGIFGALSDKQNKK